MSFREYLVGAIIGAELCFSAVYFVNKPDYSFSMKQDSDGYHSSLKGTKNFSGVGDFRPPTSLDEHLAMLIRKDKKKLELNTMGGFAKDFCNADSTTTVKRLEVKVWYSK